MLAHSQTGGQQDEITAGHSHINASAQTDWGPTGEWPRWWQDRCQDIHTDEKWSHKTGWGKRKIWKRQERADQSLEIYQIYGKRQRTEDRDKSREWGLGNGSSSPGPYPTTIKSLNQGCELATWFKTTALIHCHKRNLTIARNYISNETASSKRKYIYLLFNFLLSSDSKTIKRGKKGRYGRVSW